MRTLAKLLHEQGSTLYRLDELRIRPQTAKRLVQKLTKLIALTQGSSSDGT